MQRLCVCSFFYFCILLLPVPRTNTQDPPATANTYVPANVPNSVAGFQAQVDELVRIGKMHDQATWNIALDTFALPKASTWFEANFAVQHAAHLSQDYPKVREGHLGHISWCWAITSMHPHSQSKLSHRRCPRLLLTPASNLFFRARCIPSLCKIFA